MATERLPSYGGQALMEGVLMRGAKAVSAAMRDPNGVIQTHTERLSGIYLSPLKSIPFLRGLVILWDSLGLGMRFLIMSANTQTGEDEKLEGPALTATLAVSLLMGVGIFMVLPSLLGQGVESLTGWPLGWVNLVEGILRMVIAIGYIWGIGRLPDIARVFMYHGAEHKTINAYEAGAELTPESVQRFSLEHPRCGTGFLLTVVVFSIFIFSPLRSLPFLVRVPAQLALTPVIACLAYEYIRWTANHLNSAFVRWLIKPNLALQKLTTRQPTLEMLEVSITAFNSMLEEEHRVVT